MCTINYKDFKDKWIFEAENKIARRANEGEIWKTNELHGERIGLFEMKQDDSIR